MIKYYYYRFILNYIVQLVSLIDSAIGHKSSIKGLLYMYYHCVSSHVAASLV